MRKLTDVELDGVDRRDSPDFADAYIAAASWEDTGEALTEEELNAINEDFSLIYSYVIRQLC